MTQEKIKVEIEEVEVMNSSENPEQITKVQIDETSAGQKDSQDTSPLGKIMENIEEFKKIRGFFLASLLVGFTSLFIFRFWLGSAAIILGILDIVLGSKLTRKPAYVGISMGLIALLIYFA